MIQSFLLEKLVVITKELKSPSRTEADIVTARETLIALVTTSNAERDFINLFVDLCDYLLGRKPDALIRMRKEYRLFFIHEFGLAVS